MNQWTFLDFLFALIILASVFMALRKGLIREIVSLAALIGGFILAVLYYRVPASLLAEFSKTDSVASLLAFMIIFVGCLILGAILSFILNRFMKAVSIKWIDRLLGGIFGLLRGWAICSVMVLAIVAFPIRENTIARSILAPYLLAGARAAVVLVPQELKDKFNEQYQKVVKAWSQSRSAS